MSIIGRCRYFRTNNTDEISFTVYRTPLFY